MKRFFILVSLLLVVCLCAACGAGTAGPTSGHDDPDNGTVGSGTVGNDTTGNGAAGNGTVGGDDGSQDDIGSGTTDNTDNNTTNNNQSTIDAPYIMTASGVGASMFLDQEGRVFIAGNADNQYVTWSASGTYTQEIPFPEKIRKIGMSSYCAYALSEKGSLWIWGSNVNGQLCQDDLTLQTTTPIKLNFDHPIADFDMSDICCIASTSSETCYVWGNNTENVVGFNPNVYPQSVITKPISVQLGTGQIADYVVAGENSVSLLTKKGDYLFAGDHVDLQGDPSQNIFHMTSDLTSGPSYFVELKDLKKHDSGEYFNLYLMKDGKLLANGYNSYGELGQGHCQVVLYPVSLNLSFTPADFCAFENGALILSDAGDVYGLGKLGDQIYQQPVKIPVSKSVVAISLSRTHATLADKDGGLWIATFPLDSNQIQVTSVSVEEKTAVSIAVPSKAPVFNVNDVVDVVNGNSTTIARMKNGDLFAWAIHNAYHHSGIGVMITPKEPTYIPLDEPIVDVYLSGDQSLALGKSGTVYSWGKVRTSGFDTAILEPRALPIPEKIVELYVGDVVTFAKAKSGTWYQWGYVGSKMMLGEGSDVTQPTKFDNKWNFVTISSNVKHALGLDEQGRVWSWGVDFGVEHVAGEETPFIAEPQLISLPEKATAVCAGNSFSYAIGESGTLYGWGKNIYGSLFKEEQELVVPTPIVLMAGTKVKSISCSVATTFVVTRSDDLYYWGITIDNDDDSYAYIAKQKLVSAGKAISRVSSGLGHGVICYQDGSYLITNEKIFNPFK